MIDKPLLKRVYFGPLAQPSFDVFKKGHKMRNFRFHISAIRGFAAVTALSMALSATAFAQTDDAKLEAIENAYRSGDLETARAGLVEIAENASGQTQYRLGFMIANSQGGPFDRAEAIRWLESALKNEHNAGKLLLARVYLTGYPEVVEYERAAELLADDVLVGRRGSHAGDAQRVGDVEPVVVLVGHGHHSLGRRPGSEVGRGNGAEGVASHGRQGGR